MAMAMAGSSNDAVCEPHFHLPLPSA